MSSFNADILQQGGACLVILNFKNIPALLTSEKKVEIDIHYPLEQLPSLTEVCRAMIRFLLAQTAVHIYSVVVEPRRIFLAVDPKDVADDGLQIKFAGLNWIIESSQSHELHDTVPGRVRIVRAA